MDQAIDLRRKTTLLKKVCNSVEEPEIFGPYGNRLDLEVVEGSAKRGQHDIENQLIFQSNRQFIFHDSRGFESGSANEIQTVKDFITERAARGQLSKQLHAIWYCMPTDTTRPLLAADEQFFNVSGTGKVPVIAIFTKFDGLVDEAYSELRERGQSILDAKNGAPERAQTMLTSNFIGPLNKTKFRPSDFVRLDDMRMEQSDCIDLINKTAHALSDETLKLLFVSVQQNNIDVCIYYAMRGVLSNTYYDVTWFIKRVIVWFPHTWVHCE
ncbi:hypothetical protein C8R45DRAFT_594438 [Mycena sanguinolenta]|nr:hypothetical protein C8R45DRAFT_594438 [Mycena sanguinolenta]